MATVKSSNINITDLDFGDVSDSLKEYLKGQTVLKDYNFEGSNLAVLVDLLAYSAHTSAFNANMVASNGAKIESKIHLNNEPSELRCSPQGTCSPPPLYKKPAKIITKPQKSTHR